MNIKMSKTSGLLTAILVLIFFSPMSAFAVDPLDQVVEISCTGAIPNVNLCDIHIGVGRAVRFEINPATCDTVFISGPTPIGNFTLRDTNPQTTITFPTTGEFFYTVTDSVSDMTKTGCSVRVVQPPFPSLSSLGMIVLVALIIVAGVYLLMRRKPTAA
ncbi:MAG: hypothetical protein V1890_03340 [Candidatus Zixiibacteriota bacterium]